jgi:hypothetical protein
VGTTLALVKLSPLLIKNVRVHDLEKKIHMVIKFIIRHQEPWLTSRIVQEHQAFFYMGTSWISTMVAI